MDFILKSSWKFEVQNQGFTLQNASVCLVTSFGDGQKEGIRVADASGRYIQQTFVGYNLFEFSILYSWKGSS